MFGLDFFPTPKGVALEMLSGLDFRNIKTVLEPSAGKGDIIDVIKEVKQKKEMGIYKEQALEIDAMEIDPSLRAILEKKGIRVIGDDFLSTPVVIGYDLIILNPPFSEAQAHLERAMAIQSEFGGELVCLLPANFVKSPNSRKKETLVRQLKETGASFAFIQDGFVDAERKTTVETVVVKASFKKKSRVSLILETFEKEKATQSQHQVSHNALVCGSDFRAIENLYRHDVALVSQMYDDFSIIKSSVGLKDLTLNFYRAEVDKDTLIRRLRQNYWDLIFKTKDFRKLLTRSAHNELASKMSDLLHYDVSVFNILELRRQLATQFVLSMEESILSIFDKLSHEYSYMPETRKNKLHYDGWKSNSAYKLNKKVVYPMQTYDKIFNQFRMSHSQADFLLDIEKAMQYLNGMTICTEESEKIIEKARDSRQDAIILPFFSLKCYKKGTIHIQFTDLESLNLLNQFVAAKRAWLPPDCEWKKSS